MADADSSFGDIKTAYLARVLLKFCSAQTMMVQVSLSVNVGQTPAPLTAYPVRVQLCSGDAGAAVANSVAIHPQSTTPKAAYNINKYATRMAHICKQNRRAGQTAALWPDIQVAPGEVTHAIISTAINVCNAFAAY